MNEGEIIMFCYKCGEKLPDNAIYCIKCGVKLALVNPSDNTSNVEIIDRFALEMYLKNVMVLEFAIHRYTSKLDALKQLEKKYLPYYTKSYEFYDKHGAGGRSFLNLKYQNNHIYILAYNTPYMKYICFDDYLHENVGFSTKFVDIDANPEYIKNPDNYLALTSCNKSKKYVLKEELAVMDKCAGFFSKFRVEAEPIVRKNIELRNKYGHDWDGILSEMRTAKSLLQKNYDINIIPDSFRNLYAVHYLYNFIKTSQESLTSAFLHVDLNDIKNKLDKVLRNQEEIILNQEIMISQNANIIRQNQEKLEKIAFIKNSVKEINDNMELTTKYTQIAACNSEACAWLSIANYLK